MTHGYNWLADVVKLQLKWSASGEPLSLAVVPPWYRTVVATLITCSPRSFLHGWLWRCAPAA
jgi:hypothetical protein